MGSDRLPEPWHSFLTEVDVAATQDIALDCIGGFAVALYYGLSRPTADIDIVEVRPHAAKGWLRAIAGEGSALHKKHKVYLDIVTVSSIPDSYEDRIREIFPNHFQRLHLFVLDPIDLVLSKLSRNRDRDLEDAKHLVRSTALDLNLLESRYQEELRFQLSGPPSRHDQTLNIWLEIFREERERQS